jgi:hypothetical protein
MTGSELITEGKRLARPCVLLRDEGPTDRLAAVWRGPGIVPVFKDSYLHWLTIDCRFLPAGLGPAGGCLSVYTDENDCESGMALYNPSASLAVKEGPVELFATEARSLPPIDAIFRLGSPSVHDWLASQKWQPEWGYNENFKDPTPAREYLRNYQAVCPLYAGGAHAVLGGWHFPWPDGDWEERIDGRLLIWTFEESEPWVEVWGEGEGFRVMQRIT